MKNLAPRIGLAWDIFGDGRTSLRASYGISYEPLTIAYVGNQGHHQLLLREFNPAVFRTGATTGNTEARRLYAPTYSSIGRLYSDGNSAYNALQAQVNSRFSRGLSVNVAYTFSSAFDEGGQDNFANVGQAGPQNPFDRKGERGPSDGNVRHRFVASYLYALPFFQAQKNVVTNLLGGWELGGIVNLRTGAPINVNAGRDNSLTAVGYDRPNLIGDPFAGIERGSLNVGDLFFNRAAFQANAAGTFGTLSRNAFRGFGFKNWDVSLRKAFRIVEGHNLQFRWDAFNVLNQVNLRSITSNFNSANFGRVNAVNDARIMQFSLKYQF